MEKIKVFLVDDHDILMDGIEAILQQWDDICVIGKANSAEKAEQYLKVHQPDVLITDINMGQRSGLELTKNVRKNYPEIKIVVLSMYADHFNISTMMKAGASAYLLKNVKNQELHQAILKVVRQQTYIQESIAAAYQNHALQKARNEKSHQLSPREIEIIKLILEENSTVAISKKLFISAHTVETHRKNIWRKTGAKTIIGLNNYARAHQLI